VQLDYACYHLFAGVCLVDSNAIQVSVAQSLQKVACIGVNLDGLLFQGRNLRDKVQSSFALLFLQFQGDTTDGSLGDTAHQVRCVTSDLVAHALGRQDSNIIDDTLVGVKVQRETRVVLFDDSPGGLLYGLGSDTL
jgi:hypothetical protein